MDDYSLKIIYMKNLYLFGIGVSFILMFSALIYGVATPRVLPNCFGIVLVCLMAIYGSAYFAMDKSKANLCFAIGIMSAVAVFFCAAFIRMIAVS